MDSLGHLLQQSDPLRHETSRLDAERVRIRSAILAAGRRTPATVNRRAFLVSALIAISLLAGASAYRVGMFRLTPLVAQVRLDIRLAEEHPVPGLVVAQVANTGRVVYLHPETVAGNDDIAGAWVVDEGSARFGVAVQFLPNGAERMRQATANHVGKPVAIVIDGIVATAPTVRSPMSDAATISGSFTREQADRIADGVGPR